MFGLSTTSLVFGIISTVALLFWLLLFMKGKKYNSMFEVLDEKEYPLKEVYGLGYAALEMFHYKYKSKADRKLRSQIEILYGSQYVDYYLRVIHSEQLTFSLSLSVLAFAMYGLSGEILAVIILLVFAGLSYYYFGTTIDKKIQKRSEELLRDFSEVVSKLALLSNAGMILREAWSEIAYNGEGAFYYEMRRAVDAMNNGSSEADAIYDFGTRCILPEIKKFTSTIIQGLAKGPRDLTIMLQAQSKEVWDLKKQLVRRAGEKAASKLLIPICIMFVGILIMIIVPIFANLGA